MARGDEARSPA